ncbi:Hypothetical predicted protein [Lecanosticta acicola]|uniref:Kinetochore protein mis14 n=1 Tax=Lecanosticta acicola TaxID=111012 RepID=A0AAI9ECU2_9PEZI|nr:Hypothetical predicted protein [Lecanosticta acicola]
MATTNIFESAFPQQAQQGHRATDSPHRKIELQSPQDLTYLIANVSRAASEKLDRHLPPDAPEGDLRQRVEVLVQAYVAETFERAKDSIVVNGIEAREVELGEAGKGEEELESFDAKLAQKIQSLAAQIERETLYLANKRRRAPQETARNFLAAFEEQGRVWDAKLEREQEVRVAAARKTELQVGRVERVGEMQSAWVRGREDLAGLKGGMEGTLERMERARKAVEAVEK